MAVTGVRRVLFRSRAAQFAELKRQLDVADSDIALVNKRLDESQGMQLLRGHPIR